MLEEEHVFIKSGLRSGKRVDFGRIDEKGPTYDDSTPTLFRPVSAEHVERKPSKANKQNSLTLECL
jgi:hypothetical protein